MPDYIKVCVAFFPIESLTLMARFFYGLYTCRQVLLSAFQMLLHLMWTECTCRFYRACIEVTYDMSILSTYVFFKVTPMFTSRLWRNISLEKCLQNVTYRCITLYESIRQRKHLYRKGCLKFCSFFPFKPIP